MICKTKKCPNQIRPQPGAIFCPECQASNLAIIKRRWYKLPRRATLAESQAEHSADLVKCPVDIPIKRDKPIKNRPAVLFVAPRAPLSPLPDTDWLTGRHNVTCPACAGRYHFGAPAPFTHLCPLCEIWLCWKDTGQVFKKMRRIAKDCPTCDGLMTKRPGQYGEFYGCDSYPQCRGTRQGNDYATITEERPRMALAVWEPHTWTQMDQNAEDRADLFDRVEGFEAWLKTARRA